MPQHGHIHATHPAIIARLKRVSGHLKTTIAMIETGRSCVELAQQLHAIERAVANAKKTLIHDHIDHCLDRDAHGEDGHIHFEEMKEITKYL